MMGTRTIIFLLSLVITSISAGLLYLFLQSNVQTIHIAMIGPMSGENSPENGQSHLRGIQMYLDEIKSQNLLPNKKIILDVYDDQNDSELAKQMALKVATETNAVAVIGHNYSSSSISAGEVYKKYGLPAISPSSTNPKVTQNNDWFFRTVFTNELQGRFLAHYAKKILNQNTVSVISKDSAYGTYLAKVFQETAQSLGIAIKYHWQFSAAEGTDLTQQLQTIVDDLATKPDAGALFLATHATEGILLLQKLEEAGIKWPIIAPNAYASKAFKNREIDHSQQTDYYSGEMYVSAPLLFDSASDKASKFRDRYNEIYHDQPDWRTAFAYDAAMVVIAAIEHAAFKAHLILCNKIDKKFAII